MGGHSIFRSSQQQPSRYRGLADALSAGIPPVRALELVALEDEPAAAAASRLVARGEPLTRAIELLASPPHHHRVALEAAERAGRLPETLRALADDLDAEAAARRTLWGRAAYPLLLLHLVVPATSTGILIEDPGRFVLRTAIALAGIWSLLLGGAWLLRRWLESPAGARQLARAPLIGRPIRLAAQLRFLRALAALYGAGVRIDVALSEASSAVGSAPPTLEYERAAAIARDGESIERALAVLLGFDPLDRMELVTAAHAGNLEHALERVALRTQQAWETSLQRAARVAAAVLYFLAFVVIVSAIVNYYSGYFAQLSSPKLKR